MNQAGNWIRAKRKELRMRQEDVATRAGVSVSYISTLERDQPHSETGVRIVPDRDKIVAIAKAVHGEPGELLNLYGYAGTPKKPTNAREFLNALESLGVEFGGAITGIEHLSPDEYENLLESVKIAVEVSLRRRK